MKHLLSILFVFVSLLTSFAQSKFDGYIMDGDVKMSQHFYEMALKSYSKAREVASDEREIRLSEDKIAKVHRTIKEEKDRKARQEQEKQRQKQKQQKVQASPDVPQSSFLFTGSYLETGDIYTPENGEITGGMEDFPLTEYEFVVYTDQIVISKHFDSETNADITENAAGTVLKLKEETSDYRMYCSDRDNAFVFCKDIAENAFGTYCTAIHVISGVNYYLYAENEVKALMSDTLDGDGESAVQENQGPTPSPVPDLSFTDNWVLNMDADGNRMGDTRSEPIRASDVCFLLFRAEYVFAGTTGETVTLDLKLYDPAGSLITMDGDNGLKKGVTSSESLDVLPEGGVFSFSIGGNFPGLFSPGDYRLEIWYGKEKIYTITVRLV